MMTSIAIAVVFVTSGVIGTVTLPPPAGTIADPLPEDAPFETPTETVALAHPAATPLTVTLATELPDSVGRAVIPSESHRPIAICPAPTVCELLLKPAAAANPLQRSDALAATITIPLPNRPIIAP